MFAAFVEAIRMPLTSSVITVRGGGKLLLYSDLRFFDSSYCYPYLYCAQHGFVQGYKNSKIQPFKDSRVSGGDNCRDNESVYPARSICCTPSGFVYKVHHSKIRHKKRSLSPYGSQTCETPADPSPSLSHTCETLSAVSLTLSRCGETMPEPSPGLSQACETPARPSPALSQRGDGAKDTLTAYISQNQL
jgi:hypothetical protein